MEGGARKEGQGGMKMKGKDKGRKSTRGEKRKGKKVWSGKKRITEKK